MKATTTWAPSLRLPPSSPSSQSPHSSYCKAALARTVIAYGYISLNYINIQFPVAYFLCSVSMYVVVPNQIVQILNMSISAETSTGQH